MNSRVYKLTDICITNHIMCHSHRHTGTRTYPQSHSTAMNTRVAYPHRPRYLAGSTDVPSRIKRPVLHRGLSSRIIPGQKLSPSSSEGTSWGRDTEPLQEKKGRAGLE